MQKAVLSLFFMMVVCVNLVGSLQANTFDNNKKLQSIFEKNGVNGTLVIYDAQKDLFIGYNSKRANIQYSPASTFKIANSIIGLATGAVGSVDEIFFKYQGQEVFLDSWKKDSSLRDAIKVSNFVAYQELARLVGRHKLQESLNKMNYGNMKMNKIDTFWVDNSLKISAIEQVKFLTKLATLKLPYSKNIQQEVASIILLDKNDKYTLYGKSGWYVPEGGLETIGWLVGWVHSSSGLYIFAMNMDIKKKEAKDFPEKELNKRQNITLNSLKELGILN